MLYAFIQLYRKYQAQKNAVFSQNSQKHCTLVLFKHLLLLFKYYIMVLCSLHAMLCSICSNKTY